jgi:dipeptidyl aminopeptidase/acylaminoacyl peptidase
VIVLVTFDCTLLPLIAHRYVVEYAVTDLVYDMQNLPFSWGLHLDEVKRYFGDPDNEADLVKMKECSPLTHARDVQGAILITAGKEDRNVGFEQSEEFERALKAAGKDVTAVYFEKEGHGYDRWQTEVQRARLIENFLAKHLVITRVEPAPETALAQ